MTQHSAFLLWLILISFKNEPIGKFCFFFFYTVFLISSQKQNCFTKIKLDEDPVYISHKPQFRICHRESIELVICLEKTLGGELRETVILPPGLESPLHQ